MADNTGHAWTSIEWQQKSYGDYKLHAPLRGRSMRMRKRPAVQSVPSNKVKPVLKGTWE
jgi:hypothetical protein